MAGSSPDFSLSNRYTNPVVEYYPSKPTDIDLGTTLVAIKFAWGVVVGADTRTSVSSYVSNKLAYKINVIISESSPDECRNEQKSVSTATSCVVCRSGSAAETQWVATKSKNLFQTKILRRPHFVPTISQVAHYIKHCIRNESGQREPLQTSMICAGYDAKTGGGKIFGIAPGGSLWEEHCFCVSGSGSTLLLGFLDSMNTNQVSSTYSKDQAIELVTNLLRLSITRDGGSGGLVRLVILDENGVQEITQYPENSNVDTVAELEGFARRDAGSAEMGSSHQ